MCFNLEKDKTEILQESKWSLKPRALHINNVVSLKKITQKPNSKAQTMNVFIFQVEYEDIIHYIYPCIAYRQNYSWFLKKYYLSLFERANVQSLQTIGGSRNVFMLSFCKDQHFGLYALNNDRGTVLSVDCTAHRMKQLLFHFKTVFQILIYFSLALVHTVHWWGLIWSDLMEVSGNIYSFFTTSWWWIDIISTEIVSDKARVTDI